MNQQTVKAVALNFKSDPVAGLAFVNAKLSELLPNIEDPRLVQSTVEGNTFRWSEDGYTAAEWFTFWTKVKQEIEAMATGASCATGAFVPKFGGIQH